MSEYDKEPVPGLPEHLPVGETILWQGSPQWWSVALRVFHVRKVVVYFMLLAAWRIWMASDRGATPAEIAVDAILPVITFGGAAVVMLLLLAWLTQRTTLYTLTDKRIAMRFGIALPITWNLPLSAIETAVMKVYGDGTGNIALLLKGDQRLAYLVMWPHVRPWRLRKPEPMLRSVPDAERFAAKLRAAIDPSSRHAAERPIETIVTGESAGYGRHADGLLGGNTVAA